MSNGAETWFNHTECVICGLRTVYSYPSWTDPGGPDTIFLCGVHAALFESLCSVESAKTFEMTDEEFNKWREDKDMDNKILEEIRKAHKRLEEEKEDERKGRRDW